MEGREEANIKLVEVAEEQSVLYGCTVNIPVIGERKGENIGKGLDESWNILLHVLVYL